MHNKSIAIVTTALLFCSSIDYCQPVQAPFKIQVTKEEVPLKESKYGHFLKLYKAKVKENEERQKRELEEKQKRELEEKKERERKEKERRLKEKQLDRGCEGNYEVRENVKCIITYYTNINNALQGGCYDSRGKLLTSHGMKVCAVPSNIPYGSLIELEGMGTYKAVDTGGAIKWTSSNTMKVDVFVPNVSTEHLYKLGKKTVQGKIHFKK